MSAAPAATVLRAILMALGAYASFSLMDTLVKLLSARFHPIQIACFVATAGLIPAVASALLRRDPRALQSRAWRLQFGRGLLMLIGGVAAFVSYTSLPLADAYAIGFTQPLIVTALAWPLLGERVGVRRWAAVLVSFIGVLIVLRPGIGVLGPGAIAALVNALCNGSAIVLIRRARASEPAEAFAFWGNAVIATGTALALSWFWVMPTLSELALFLVAGLLGGTSFLVLAHSIKLAPAATIAPFQYSQMTYAILAGLFVFGDMPDPLTLIGAAVIIASGLYVLRRETQAARPAATLGAQAKIPS
jgi:drug/metabolite transporter (DMT)-like permease